ncbi:hypothetical protein WJX79_002064 [Trebouxia sp. C0005]|nr:MAG: hypothetical protein FRX49_07105 [Trebouxia sp. A1-2]
MPTGTLLIGVEEGHNLEDRGFVTKQNPLCQVNVGSVTHKTDAARHGGANPIWEERFVAYLDDAAPQEAEIIVWSEHHIAEGDEIGRGKISLADAYLHSYQESKVPIVTPAGKHAGEVEIFFAFASKEEKEIPKSSDGQLSLRVIRAQDLQETGVIKYQDPFVVMETSRAKFKTTIAQGAGRDPEWKEAFEFQVASDVQDIKMIIYNKNTLTDDTVIGSAVYPLAQAISTGFEESKVPVATPDGPIQGSLHIRAIFHSKFTH